MKNPADLRYTEEHEWLSREEDGAVAVVGITDFAQRELGDVVFVELESEGTDLEKDEIFGTVEAVKTVAELYLPVSGRIVAVNEKLNDTPELVNDDPYGDGWMIRIKLDDPSELDGLLDAAAYSDMTAS